MMIKPESQSPIDYYTFDNQQECTSITSNSQDSELCRICSNPHDGSHFGVETCRACAAFYRRSVVEQRVYSCKSGQNSCQLHCVEQRKICRACRLKRCHEVGMLKSGVQMHREPLGDPDTKIKRLKKYSSASQSSSYTNYMNSNSPQSSTSNSESLVFFHNDNSLSSIEWQNSPSTSSSSMSTNHLIIIDNPRERRPMLEHITNGYVNWDITQKYVHAAMFPTEKRKMRIPTYADSREMDSACVSLINTMLEDYFPPFNTISIQLKECLMPKFVKMFRILERSVKGERLFGSEQSKSECIYIQYGQYLKLDDLEAFFEGEPNANEAARTIRNVTLKCVPFMKKLHYLKVRDVEVAALSAVLLWNLLLEITDQEYFETLRDRAFNELHEDLLDEYGDQEAPTRQMELAYLLSSVNAVMHEVDIFRTTNRLLNILKLSDWDNRL